MVDMVDMVDVDLVDVDLVDAVLRVGCALTGSRSTMLAPVLEGALRGDARSASLRQHRCRKVAEEGDPRGSGEQPREQSGDPGRRAEGAECGGRSDDDAPAACSKTLGGLGIMGDPSECAHGDPVTLDAPGLIVIVTAQPHGDQNGGPEGHDRHIDQTRHINERYVDSSPEWWISGAGPMACRGAAERTPRRGSAPGVDSGGHPPNEKTLRHLVSTQGEGEVIAPITIDMEIALPDALLSEAELLHHPQ